MTPAALRHPSVACALALGIGLTLPGLGSAQQRTPVAVLQFENNSGDDRYQHLGRGLGAMMISDLSVVEEIQLVERERLEQLVTELDFQQSPYADSTTAQTVGLMVGAEYLVTGAFLALEPEIRIDTRVVRVETAEIVKTAQVTGERDQFFDLQQRLADELIDGFAIAISPESRARLRQQQEANRIDDLDTANAYARALCYLDRGDEVSALDQLIQVRNAAPNSAIVESTSDRLQDEAVGRVATGARREVSRNLGRLGNLGRAIDRNVDRPAVGPGC